MAGESRAEYFRERREKIKYFSAEVDVDTLKRLTEHLKLKKKTKKEWLNEKITETLAENK